VLLVSAEDLRPHTGTQDFVASAPLDMVYVADFSRMTDVREEDRSFLAGAEAGCIAQNVYLYCAGTGLATVVRGMVDRRSLARMLHLSNTQRITLAQTVGYPGREPRRCWASRQRSASRWRRPSDIRAARPEHGGLP
jgi:nitroreductase